MAIFYVTANAPNSNTGASWNTATSLQTALTSANPGDEIWLAQGTYTPGNNPNDTFSINQALQLYGGFNGNETDRTQRDWIINQTMLSGSDVNNTVVNAQSTASEALIDGVIIQAGNSNDDGGGVYNRGNGLLTLQNTIVQNNQAADDGGGIRNDGELTILNSNIINNTTIGTSATSGGGGLLNTAGSLVTIVNSTFSGNTAPNGGGIRNDGSLNLTNSTLSGNTASDSGGGLANTVNIDNSGFFPVVVGTATATIANSTLVNNTAQNTSGQFSVGGGGLANFGTVTVTGSIIANNVGNDDIADVNFLIGSGATASGGHNFIGNGDDVAGLTNGINNDQVGTAAVALNPQLGALQANGGFTPTHTPQSTSPVIDAGASNLPTDTFDLDGDSDTAEELPVDQRGFPFVRVVGTAVDIGAVESQVVLAPAITLMPTAGLITTELGGTATFTAALASQPTNAVTLGFTSNDPSEGSVTPSITFTTTNWNAPQTVTVTGVDDADDDGDVAYIINTSVSSTDTRYSGLPPVSVAVTNQDDDEPISPTPPNPINPVPARLIPQGERLRVEGSGNVLIDFSISQNASDQVQEIIVFATDASGAVDGLTPNDPDYLAAVLAEAQVIFSTLEPGDIPTLAPNRTLTAAAGSLLQFAIIKDGSLDSLRRGAGGTLALTTNGQSTVTEPLSNGAVQVGFSLGQGSLDQLVVNALVGAAIPTGAALQGLSEDAELIDLRNATGTLTATIDVYREAALDSVAGLFVVENEQGQVRDALGVLMNPGDTGYAQAALAQRLDFDLQGINGETVSYTSEVLGGQLLSTFLVVDGTVADFLDGNSANDPAIYFTQTLGNSDGTDHVRLLGNNTFGFEDLAGGGDMDFDDVVIRAQFS